MASSNQDSSQGRNNNENIVCRVQMWLDGRSELPQVMESLSDPGIQFLDLYLRESFMSGFTHDQIVQVFKTIGDLSKLERLDLSCPYTYQHNNVPSTFLPVSVIPLAFTQQLTHFLLVNVKLSGSHKDFEAFAKETQRLPKLHCVVLAEVRLQKELAPVHAVSRMDPFLRSLTRMPSLGHVLISGTEGLGVLQPSTLRLRMHTLRDLCLSQLSLSTPHLQALAQNPLSNLRELDLQCHLTVDGARALAQLLEHNDTLEELTLRLTTSAQSYTATPRTAAALAVLNMDALEAEEEEEEETTDDSNPHPEYQRNAILAAGIVKSKRLSSFELERANLSTPTLLEPFLQMLRDNYSLETVRLNCRLAKSYQLESEIAFYTRLNHLGRGHLFQCPHCSHCDESYLSMLDCLKDDINVSAFYYFLSRKPSLLRGACHFTCPSTAPRKVLGKRKRLYRAVKYNGVSYKN